MLYAERVLDHNHNGTISLKEASKDPIFQSITITQTSPTTVKLLLTGKVVPTAQLLENFKNSSNSNNNNNTSSSKQNYISLDKKLKPLLLDKLHLLLLRMQIATLRGVLYGGDHTSV